MNRNLNGIVTYYVYDGEKPIVEYNATGTITAKNLYGKAIDEILLRTDYTITPNRILYYQQDHEGSVTHLINAASAVVESYRYDAFGKPTINGNPGLGSSPLGNRFMFTGREYAAAFGIYEYRARAYNPVLGRFMSEDPKGFAAGDYNLFRYCKNDPLDATDPLGLYARAPGEWTDKEWDKFSKNQDKAIKIAEAAKKAVDHAAADPNDKASASTLKACKQVFGKNDQATLQKISKALADRLVALKDNGSGGYFAHPQTDGQIRQNLPKNHNDPNKVVAWTIRNTKDIYINVGRWGNAALTWAIDHEAGHDTGGFYDNFYMNDKKTWNYSAGQAPHAQFLNADSHTAFAHMVGE